MSEFIDVTEDVTIIETDDDHVEVIEAGVPGPQGPPGPQGSPATNLNINQSTVPTRNATGIGEPDGFIGRTSGSAAPNTLAQRTSTGALFVATATDNAHAIPKAQMDALVPIYGTGFPNGVVTAPTGRIYIDNNGTNGVSSWIKKSGTGNTGWQVLEGDTGWRNIGTWLVNGWTAIQARTRRVNGTAYFGFEALNAATMTNIVFLDVPLGFRSSVPAYSDRQFITTAASPAQVWRVTAQSAAMSVQGATTGLALTYGAIDYLTNDAWPTTLPGTAI